MTTEQVWVSAICVSAAAGAFVALVLAVQARGRAARAETLAASLVERIAALEGPGAVAGQPAPGHDDSAYVITRVDSAPEPLAPLARPIDGRLFTDIVARETVVKAASLTHGLRRALSAESRNRIRFAVRQETRRAGRGRRAETKQALREFRARERGAASARDAGEDVA